MDLKVLYEDNHLIVVYKPAGVLTQADISGQRCLMDDVKDYLKEKYKKPGNVFLGMVHRLDRSVSGVIVFAKTSKGASRLSQQIRLHEVEKNYHAVISGKLENQKGILRTMLGKDENEKKAHISDNGKEAELSYEVVKSNDNYSLVRIKLETGKFHQIRAQFSSIGSPIVGDNKYGSKEVLPDKTICLAATSLKFRKATEDEFVTVSVPIPVEWDKYFN
jgi:23S rRNA pseudouridine1911/1915/1917 synthase